MKFTEFTPALLQSLKLIKDHGISHADVSLGHVLRLHYLGLLENQNVESKFISSMRLTKRGIEALSGKVEVVEPHIKK